MLVFPPIRSKTKTILNWLMRVCMRLEPVECFFFPALGIGSYFFTLGTGSMFPALSVIRAFSKEVSGRFW